MTTSFLPGPADAPGFWLDSPEHRDWLIADAKRQFAFFRASLRPDGGFYTLDYDGAPLPSSVQELHTTTRLVHAYSLGKLAGVANCDAIIEQGMAYLDSHHRDREFGGYLWALDGDAIHDARKLAYGQVFVLLAGASAHAAGHPRGKALIEDAAAVLDAHFWEEQHGLFCDEWNRDWTPFSRYRGMNANMHGTEALLAAFEATGELLFLDRAGRILDFFLRKIAPSQGWRIAEHYTGDWQIDRDYAGDPMFRPPGTTPGHACEFARLLLQYWDLRGRPDDGSPSIARQLIERALADAWDVERGGLVYTLDHDGRQAIRARYWWPVTEAIGALAALIKLERDPRDEVWYRRLWQFAATHFVDQARGGWYPEIDESGRPSQTQFVGKPDIYHSVQGVLFPAMLGVSGIATALDGEWLIVG
jgi:mannose/cellobiose epimerase-like protein (N-acyl-D-glucosamine 2-epimerase family)